MNPTNTSVNTQTAAQPTDQDTQNDLFEIAFTASVLNSTLLGEAQKKDLQNLSDTLTQDDKAMISQVLEAYEQNKDASVQKFIDTVRLAFENYRQRILNSGNMKQEVQDSLIQSANSAEETFLKLVEESASEQTEE